MQPAPSKFMGTAQQCFDDLVTKHPQLQMVELLAEFCRTNIEVVQRWQRAQYWPGGELQLRLRCFLELAGYEVDELNRLQRHPRMLVRLIGLTRLEPRDIAKGVGYRSSGLQSIWRIALQGDSQPSPEVGARIEQLAQKHSTTQATAAQHWQQRISALTASRQPTAEPPEPPRLPVDPQLLATFARAVAMTASLGRMLLDHNEAIAVREATRGGQDLVELKEILERLVQAS